MYLLGSRRLIPSTSMLMAFEAAARSGSFTAAAKELDLTQGAISRQVSALEEQLGVKLFNRVGKAVEINEVGRAYAHEIATSLQTISNASLDVMSDPKGGILNLAILPTFGMRWLMPRFSDFLEHNPQITVNFATKLSPFDFGKENLHAAIHFGKADWPGVESTYLMGEQVFPVGSSEIVAGLPLEKVSDLTQLPLLHLETRPKAWASYFEQNGVEGPVGRGAVFSQFALVTQAAVAGMGVALLPRFLIENELERGELAPLINIPYIGQEGYYLVSPKRRSSYAPVVAFRKWLLKQGKN